MKSLMKRRTSTAADQLQTQQGTKNKPLPRASHTPRSPPPMQDFGRPGRSSTMPIGMPDLRFSRLDLEPKREDGFGGFVEDDFAAPVMSPPPPPQQLRRMTQERHMSSDSRQQSYDGRGGPSPSYYNGQNGRNSRSPHRASAQLRDGYSTSADAYVRSPPLRQFSETASIAPSVQSRQSRDTTNSAYWSSAQYYASPPQASYMRPAVGKQQVVDSATQAMNTIEAPVKAPSRQPQIAANGNYGMMMPPPPSSKMRGFSASPQPMSPEQRHRGVAPLPVERAPMQRTRGDSNLPPPRDDQRLRTKTSNATMSDARSVASAPSRTRTSEQAAMPPPRLHNGAPMLDLRLDNSGWTLQKSTDKSYEASVHSIPAQQPPRKSSRDNRLPQAPEVRRPDDMRLNDGSRVPRQSLQPPQSFEQAQGQAVPSPRLTNSHAAPRQAVPPPRQAPSRTRSGDRQIAPETQRRLAEPHAAKPRKNSREPPSYSNDEQYIRQQERSERQGPPAPRRKQSSEKNANAHAYSSEHRALPQVPSEPRVRQTQPASEQRRQNPSSQRPTTAQIPPRSTEKEAKQRNASAPPVTTSKQPRKLNAVQTTSSSDGGNTTASSGAGQRRSQESITSPEEASSDGEVRDVQSGPSHARARPRRDAERLERAQSRRISSALELEALNNAVNGGAAARSAQHAHQDSKGSAQSAFSATLKQGQRDGNDASSARNAKDGQKAAMPAQQEKAREQKSKSQAVMAERPPPPKREPEPPKVPAVELAQRETRQMMAAILAAQKRTSTGEQQSLLKRIRDRIPALSDRKARVDMVDAGIGWHCIGVGDIMTWEQERKHWRKVRETKMVKRETKEALSFMDEKPKEEMFEAKFDVYYNDLFELMWTSTTGDVSERILTHIDVADVRSLRQTCRTVRSAIGTHQECVVARALEPIGYRPWSEDALKSNLLRLRYWAPYHGKHASMTSSGSDPCPISTDDLEAFLLCGDLLEEYPLVARDYVADPRAMDRAIPQLARASTRAYNRILTRLRLQPGYKAPIVRGKDARPMAKPADVKSMLGGSPRSSIASSALRVNSPMQSMHTASQSRDSGFSAYSPNLHPSSASRPGSAMQSPMTARTASPALSMSGAPMLPDLFSSTQPSAQLHTSTSNPHSLRDGSLTPVIISDSSLKSPYKPGRAPVYRVWVPPQDPTGWLSDQEIAACEEELFKSGVWNLMKKGDIVWDVAVGEHLNEGKFVFDGHFLRDLSYAYDPAGHLPSWLNVVMFSPSYWHNVIVASSPQPIVHFDISPWRDEVLGSLRLLQDQIDTVRSNGARYRVAKWIYRASANINSGQIISKMNMPLEVVDEGWKGRIVIEMEGTAEAAKLLVERCAGSDATLRDKRALLANVMGGDMRAASKMLFINDAFAGDNSISANNAKYAARVGEVQTAPWAVIRERSRPGLIWLRPVSPRERIMG